MRPDPAERIDARAVTVWRIGGLIETFVPVIAVGVVFGLAAGGLVPPWVVPVTAAVALFTAVVSVVIVPRVRWLRWRYEVSDNEIYLLHGLVIRKRTLIPMTRVQHVDTKAGPLLRMFGLSSVTVATAGGEHEIPALADAVADKLRDRIATLARVTDDVV